jgi:hypothetical protein
MQYIFFWQRCIHGACSIGVFIYWPVPFFLSYLLFIVGIVGALHLLEATVGQ